MQPRFACENIQFIALPAIKVSLHADTVHAYINQTGLRHAKVHHARRQ